MRLTGWEIGAIYYHLGKWRRAGLPLSPSFTALYERFDRVVRFGELSPTRQESVCAPADSGHVELIGSRLAADILGWTERRVQRHAADLDGIKIGNRLVFPAASVRQYRDAIDGGRE